MLSRLVAAAAFVAVAVSSAVAADLPYKAASPGYRAVSPDGVRGINWTGWFGGVSIGYATGDVSPFLGSSPTMIELRPETFQVALHGGYDYQAPGSNLVFGVEVTIPLIEAEDTKPDPGVPGETFSTKTNWAVAVTGKVGYSIGQWLPYVGAGVGFIDATGSAVIPGVATVAVDRTHTGLILLTGLRYMFTPNWWAGLQYSYGQYSTETYQVAPAFPASARNIGFSVHAFFLQGSYRFTPY
jgi:opacity protein-like surface antigen